MPEDVIAQARRLVRDSEAEVETQRAAIASLPHTRKARSEAQAVLAILEESRDGYRAELNRLMAG